MDALSNRLSSGVDSEVPAPPPHRRCPKSLPGTRGRVLRPSRPAITRAGNRRRSHPRLRLSTAAVQSRQNRQSAQGVHISVSAPAVSAARQGHGARSALDTRLLRGDGGCRISRNHPALYHRMPGKVTPLARRRASHPNPLKGMGIPGAFLTPFGQTAVPIGGHLVAVGGIEQMGLAKIIPNHL